MTGYTATVTVRLKQGVLDPEAETTRRALKRLDFSVDSLRRSDRFEVDFTADSLEAAQEHAEAMTERLLANPTIHEDDVEVSAQ